MLSLARVIIPKHKYVNLLLKTLQSLPRGFPSPNLERSTKHVTTHSSRPLWFQHLLSAANRCPVHLTIPTAIPLVSQPASSLPSPAVSCLPCSLECPPLLSAVFYSHSKFCSNLTISQVTSSFSGPIPGPGKHWVCSRNVYRMNIQRL